MKNIPLTLLILSAFALSGCHKKTESQKMIQGFSTDVTETVVPAQAIQQDILVKNAILRTGVAVLNRIAILQNPPPTFPELTSIGGSEYTFPISGATYGSAVVTLHFYNGGSTVDPISLFSSSNTITHMTMITNAGTSPQFSYTQNLTLTLATQGDLNSNKILSGISNFSNSAPYNLDFSFLSPGRATTDGLVSGQISGTGTGPSSPITFSMAFTIDHHVQGQLTWETREGSFHFDPSGKGVLITNTERLLIP